MLHRIIYFSAAENHITETELQEILEKAKRNNELKKISGILFHIDGNIIQILEGFKENVIELFEKIKTDNRHKNVIKVIEDDIENRQFNNWNMSYNKTTFKEINQIEGLESINPLDLFSKTDNIAKTFLNTFLNSHRNLY